MNISEVSEKLNISKHTLRYYEELGIIPPIERNKKGIRIYSEEDCKWVRVSQCMKKSGMSLKAIKRYVRLCSMGSKTKEKRLKLLIKEKDKLEEVIEAMNEGLELLKKKIKLYQSDAEYSAHYKDK